MSVFSCCSTNKFKVLSRAAAKAAGARLRQIGVGSVHRDWAIRAQTCEQCPLRVISKGFSYCGDPLLERLDRDPQLHGCGCPTRAKAKSPEEHCPLDQWNYPATQVNGQCTCKWCQIGNHQRTLVASSNCSKS